MFSKLRGPCKTSYTLDVAGTDSFTRWPLETLYCTAIRTGAQLREQWSLGLLQIWPSIEVRKTCIAARGLLLPPLLLLCILPQHTVRNTNVDLGAFWVVASALPSESLAWWSVFAAGCETPVPVSWATFGVQYSNTAYGSIHAGPAPTLMRSLGCRLKLMVKARARA